MNKQESKELLIKDLCARLPYGVKCEVIKRHIDGEILYIRNGTNALELTINNVKEIVTNSMYEIKPYLFPLSSMTVEQKIEEYKLMNSNFYTSTVELPDFYNKNHIDYRGLIPMRLANDTTGLNIY